MLALKRARMTLMNAMVLESHHAVMVIQRAGRQTAVKGKDIEVIFIQQLLPTVALQMKFHCFYHISRAVKKMFDGLMTPGNKLNKIFFSILTENQDNVIDRVDGFNIYCI